MCISLIVHRKGRNIFLFSKQKYLFLRKDIKSFKDMLEDSKIRAFLEVERIVAMGDFNDTPDNRLFDSIPLINLALPLHNRGEGSIKYDGNWELIDLFFVSGSFADAQMSVLHIPFLETRDRTGGGTKPLRTYMGPRYTAGASDHCPIWLTIP